MKQFFKNMNCLLTDDKKEDFWGPMIEEEACRLCEIYAWDYGGIPVPSHLMD